MKYSLFAVLAAFALASCQQLPFASPRALVRLALETTARSIGPVSTPTADHYEASWVSDAQSKELTELSATSSFSLDVGLWTVTVRAYDAPGGKVIAETTQDVTLVAGTNNVSLSLSPVMTSTGTFQVDFDWAEENTDNLVFELEPWTTPELLDSPTSNPATFLMSGLGTSNGAIADFPAKDPFLTSGTYTYDGTAKKASFEGRLKSGTYLLRLTVKASTVSRGLYSQIIRVIDDHLSAKRFNPVRGVFYDANGGSGSMAPDKNLIGQNVLAATHLFSNSTTFLGWNTSSDGTGTAYAEGDSIMVGTDDITLYAQWSLP